MERRTVACLLSPATTRVAKYAWIKLSPLGKYLTQASIRDKFLALMHILTGVSSAGPYFQLLGRIRMEMRHVTPQPCADYQYQQAGHNVLLVCWPGAFFFFM